MSYPINYPTPQGANVQIFRGGDANTTYHVATREWVKPQGASFVWFTLIGAGGGGGGSMLDTSGPVLQFGGGGASGNVTNFMCPAFLLPDILQVKVGKGGDGGSNGGSDNPGSDGLSGENTELIYQQKNTGYVLLSAYGGGPGGGANFNPGSPGTASSVNTGGPMTAAGFYNSVAGQNGLTGGNGTLGMNGLTFVNGGLGCYYPSGISIGYYGYTASSVNGYSQLSPIPLAIAGSAPMFDAQKGVAAPFGCGGNGGGRLATTTNTNGSRGGDGLAIIVTW